MNYKLLNKIGSGILAQYPPNSLKEANNAWLNAYNGYMQHRKKQEYVCLLNNHKCIGMAIDSHSIPKKNLKLMSNNSKVYVLKNDFTNPFKSSLSTSYIKSTLTFSGFCKYHDTSLFQRIENKNNTEYNNEDIFLFSYRALAKEYSDNRELFEKYCWMFDNWKSEKKKQYDKEFALFQADKMKNLNKTVLQRKGKFLITYFEKRVLDKKKLKIALRNCQIKERKLKRRLESFNILINEGKLFDSYYVVLQNENQIAFSTVSYLLIHRKIVFLYFTSLPQKNGSLMIVSCSREDYEQIKDHPINQLFSGDEVIMNKFLNNFKEKIAIGKIYGDPFFLEWDIPLAEVPYFKSKRQSY